MHQTNFIRRTRRTSRTKTIMTLSAVVIGLATPIAACADQTTIQVQSEAGMPATVTSSDRAQTIEISRMMNILLDINGDKIQLNGTDLTPDTSLQVNGKQKRFGDLTQTQQQQLRQALQKLPHIDESASNFIIGTANPQDKGAQYNVVTSEKVLLDINGDKIELTGTDLKPDTMLKVNGKQGRFGDLSPTQQQQLLNRVNMLTTTILTTATPSAVFFTKKLSKELTENLAKGLNVSKTADGSIIVEIFPATAPSVSVAKP